MLDSKQVSKKLADFDQIKATYHEAFPKKERIPFWLLRLLALRKGVHFEAFYDEGKFVGISYYVSDDSTLFIMYLAVSSTAQSHGYGSQFLNKIVEQNPDKQIVLEIEPVYEPAKNHEQRVKRLKFYERNGFKDTGFDVKDAGVNFSILYYGKAFDGVKLHRLVKWLSFGFLNLKITKRATFK